MVQCGETTTATISFESARAIVRRNTEEVLAKGNFELFDELFADNFLDHNPAGVQTGQGWCARTLQGASRCIS
jgi:hypothetical protein